MSQNLLQTTYLVNFACHLNEFIVACFIYIYFFLFFFLSFSDKFGCNFHTDNDNVTHVGEQAKEASSFILLNDFKGFDSSFSET